MRNTFLLLAGMITAIAGFTACGGNSNKNSSSEEIENTDVVPSGTYQGTAEKVDSDEREIYVKTSDNKTLELYFTDSTKLLKNDQTAEFSALAEGQQLEVTVEKQGERLEPKVVKIIE